jgi:ubiquitin C-terminal hydrolase
MKKLNWIIVGIINVGNNCYLNAGLQILSRCYPLLIELLRSNYKNDQLLKLFVKSMKALLFGKDKFYDPSKFIDIFCKRNEDFIFGRQNCSQDFIRTILRNINDTLEKNMKYNLYYPKNQDELNAYQKFIMENSIFPESKAFSIFSGILKIQINGICENCGTKINNFSFNSFVDQILYLDSFNTKSKFSEILRKNISRQNKASMRCPNCKEKIHSKSLSTFVKIPEIFIFTLERFLGKNPKKIPIEPDEFINIYDLIDESLNINQNKCNYELFAVNIRLGNDLSSGHEICHIKEKNAWFTINDMHSYLKTQEYLENSYGLFYRRINEE